MRWDEWYECSFARRCWVRSSVPRQIQRQFTGNKVIYITGVPSMPGYYVCRVYRKVWSFGSVAARLSRIAYTRTDLPAGSTDAASVYVVHFGLGYESRHRHVTWPFYYIMLDCAQTALVDGFWWSIHVYVIWRVLIKRKWFWVRIDTTSQNLHFGREYRRFQANAQNIGYKLSY